MTPSAVLTVPSMGQQLAVISGFIAAKIPDDLIFPIHLAVEEACTNIVNYGKAQSLSISLQITDVAVCVVITDDGLPFDPLKVKPPDIEAEINTRKIGGLGVHLIRKSMDEVVYTFQEGKNVLRMVKLR
jgi:serine/threonine-protein kinase RsbW